MATRFLLVRDTNLEEVPELQSLVPDIKNGWEKIRKEIYDGAPYDLSQRNIERALSTRQESMDKGSLDPRFDWNYDFALAQFYDSYYRDWLGWYRNLRERYLLFWSDYTKNNFQYLRDLSLVGLKTIILIHGTVAIGAVNILTQKHESLVGNAVLAAKCGLIFAIAGMISAGLGQLIMFDITSNMLGRIQAKMVPNPKWQKIRAFGKYVAKHQPKLKASTFLIYGSIFWFCFYSFALFIILIS